MPTMKLASTYCAMAETRAPILAGGPVHAGIGAARTAWGTFVPLGFDDLTYVRRAEVMLLMREQSIVVKKSTNLLPPTKSMPRLLSWSPRAWRTGISNGLDQVLVRLELADHVVGRRCGPWPVRGEDLPGPGARSAVDARSPTDARTVPRPLPRCVVGLAVSSSGTGGQRELARSIALLVCQLVREVSGCLEEDLCARSL